MERMILKVISGFNNEKHSINILSIFVAQLFYTVYNYIAN